MPDLAPSARTAIAAAHVARKEKLLAPLRTQLNRAAAMHFQRQKDLLDRRLRDKFAHLNEAVLSEGLAEITAMILTDVFKETRGAFTASMQEAIVRAMQGAVRHRCADFNVDIAFNFHDPQVQAALKAYCGKQIAGIDETTRRTVAAIIGRGEADGLSYSEIARRMVKRFDQFGDPAPQKHIRNRAELIAVYELGQAYESAGRQTVNRLSAKGIPMEKSWLTVGDDRVSALCRNNQDEGWIPLDQPHQSGHQQPCGHPACRCCELYEVADPDRPAPEAQPQPEKPRAPAPVAKAPPQKQQPPDPTPAPVEKAAPKTKKVPAWQRAYEHENTIKDLEYEELTVFDRNGKPVFTKKGGEHEVSITDAERKKLAKLKDTVWTHNHPTHLAKDGTIGFKGLSNSDLSMAIGYNMAEIRAVHADGERFSITRPEKGWPSIADLNSARTAAVEAEQKNMKRLAKEGTLTRENGVEWMSENYEFNIMRRVCEQTGMEYRRYT